MSLETDLKKLLIELEGYESEYKDKKHQDGDKNCELIYRGKAEAYALAVKRLKGVLDFNKGGDNSGDAEKNSLKLNGRKVRVVEHYGMFDIEVLVPSSKFKFLWFYLGDDEQWSRLDVNGRLYYSFYYEHQMKPFNSLEEAIAKVKSLIRETAVYGHYL